MPVHLLQQSDEALRSVKLVKAYADEILKPQDNPYREEELRQKLALSGLLEVDTKTPRVLSSRSSREKE